jgi:serine/threonine protein kinase
MNNSILSKLELINADSEKSLLDKQEVLWELLEGVSIEEMVSMQLVDPSDQESILDLIVNEIRLREPHHPNAMVFIEREYLQRFSALKEPLQKHFEFERLLYLTDDIETDVELPEPDNSIALTIRGFQIISEHARGGGGVIYKAIQLSLNREVAIKVFSSTNQSGVYSYQTLREEAFKISKLFHRNIVQVFELGECDEGFYMVLPFIHGGSLKENQVRLKGEYSEITSILRDVGLAVQYAHEVGILHCDITPSNILLAEGDRPLLTDFGLSRDSEDLNGLRVIDGFLQDKFPASKTSSSSPATKGSLGGTPGYMSPEQANGDSKSLSEKTDIYGLGAVLYFLLTGDSLSNPLSKKSEEIRKILRMDCPRDLQEICIKCISMDPRDRYDSALSFSDDLARFQRGQIVKARPLVGVRNFPERVSKWSRRSPGLATLALFTAVSTSVFIGAILLSNRQLSKRTIDLSQALKSSASASFNLGRLAASSGPISQSIKAYQDAIEIQQTYLSLHPKDAEATLLNAKSMNNLAISLAKENRIDLSIKTLQDAIATLESYPNQSEDIQEWNTQLANFHANLGNQYLKRLETDKSNAHFQKAEAIRKSTTYRSSIDKQFDLAKSHYDFGNLYQKEVNGTRKAIKKFKEAILILEDIHPKASDSTATLERLTECYINLCFCQQKEGESSEIDQSLRQAIERWEIELRNDPSNLDKQKIIGTLLHNLGHYSLAVGESTQAYKYLLEAKKYFLSIVDGEESGKNTTILLGNCLTNLSHASRNIATGESSLDKRNEYFNLSLDFINQAIELLEKQRRVSPPTEELITNHLQALYARALWFSFRDEFDESIAAFQKTLEESSKFLSASVGVKMLRINTFNAMGRTIMDLPDGSLDQAISAFQKGIDECQDLIKQETDSTEVLNLMLALRSGCGQIHLRKGDQKKDELDKKGCFEISLIEFNEAVRLIENLSSRGGIQTPNEKTYLLNYFLRADVFYSLHKYDLAIGDIMYFIRSSDPDHFAVPIARAFYGLSLAKINRLQDAYKEIESFLTEANTNPMVQYYAGVCLAQVYSKLDPVVTYESVDLNDQKLVLSKAIQCLQRAEKAGFFLDPAFFDDLFTGEDLDCIRETSEFRSFLQSVGPSK